jgi:hypothetical protein
MAQFVSIVDSVLHQEEVVSAVSYQVLLIPVLTRPSMLTFVSFTQPTTLIFKARHLNGSGMVAP